MKPLFAAGIVAAAIATGGVFWDTGLAFADFVCPVLPISDEAVDNSNAGFAQIGDGDEDGVGDYSILTTIVPENDAPNNNTGAPPTDHGVPGDSDYTAIWDQDVDSGATLNPQD
jgi:hypothetical protein